MVICIIKTCSLLPVISLKLLISNPLLFKGVSYNCSTDYYLEFEL